MKTVLFVPGFEESSQDEGYDQVAASIRARGYRVKFVDIKWGHTTMTAWVRQLRQEYMKHDPAETVLAGFSFGAMIALTVAADRNPVALWLFSLSPYFAEDMKILPEVGKQAVGPRRVKVFEKLEFASLARAIRCPTLIVMGVLESEYLVKRCEAARQEIAHSNLVTVPDCEHDLADPKYIAEIVKAI